MKKDLKVKEVKKVIIKMKKEQIEYVKPFIKWVGGKSQILEEILEKLGLSKNQHKKNLIKYIKWN